MTANLGRWLPAAMTCLVLNSGTAQPPARLTDFGASPERSQAAKTTAAFRKTLAEFRDRHIVVPDGDYLLDNSGGPIVIRDFNGLLTFEPKARLVFSDNTQGGLLFIGGRGARIVGLQATYLHPPTVRRSPNEQIKFSETTDTFVENVHVEHSPSVGVLFYHCLRPKVRHAVVLRSLADGLHFANCDNPEVSDLVTADTGDDGLAFLNYAIYPDARGGSANGIKVTRSRARGITVIGQSGVTVRNFSIDGTASSGLLCGRDEAYNTRTPADVRFEQGTVVNAGSITPRVGNQFGIEYNSPESCTFSDIDVIRTMGRGLSGTAPAGTVTVHHVRVSDNAAGEGFSFYQTAQVHISESAATNVPSYGFLFDRCQAVDARALQATNTSLRSTLHRAIWFQHGGRIQATGIEVVDTQPVATGYIVGGTGAAARPQAGVVDVSLSKIRNGRLQIHNDSPGLRVRAAAP